VESVLLIAGGFIVNEFKGLSIFCRGYFASIVLFKALPQVAGKASVMGSILEAT
jgi:hypothetical protein